MRRVIAGLFALSLMLAGCGGSDEPSTSTETGGSEAGGSEEEVAGTITIAEFAYGDPLTVAPGALIRVVNEDSAEHDADAEDGTFDTDLLAQGEELTFNAPDAEGTYALVCSNHSEMSGELIVAA